MVVYSKHILAAVTRDASKALRDLIGHNPGAGTYQVRACCCCDRMMKYGEVDFISKKKVKTKAWAIPDTNTNSNIRSYYSYTGDASKTDPKLSELLLSPRSYYHERLNGKRKEGGFDICRDCNTQNDPLFSIKNYPFCGPPKELSSLNEVERAMVSQGRIDRHIFQVFAGQHNCISLWHQMHFNDCEHTLASIERTSEYRMPTVMMCSLSGPFTSSQKVMALKRVSIDLSKVKNALLWLIENNTLYKHLRLPSDEHFPVPVIIDNSNVVDSADTRIETIFETTVIFPQTDHIHENNGGNMTKEEYLADVVKDKRQYHMICRPVPKTVKLYDGDNLAKCFPLQFPYGSGGKKDRVDIQKYLKYIVDISIPSFQTAEFILPLFNLYAKTRAVRAASIRCKYKVSENTTTGDVINTITSDELEQRIKNLGNRSRHGDRNTQKLVDSVYAISKKLPFTDEAAAEERRKLFSMCTRFGLPSIFFTVTPDDLDNFRIRVYSSGTGENAPLSLHDSPDNVDKYLDQCAEIRVKYPGYCAHDFDSVLKIVIEHVIGWDSNAGTGNINKGAFGKCEAWYTPVEEQGRKTLHSHFLIWIKDWSKLLKGLYSVDIETRDKAALELSEYADHVVSTKCFGLNSGSNRNRVTSFQSRATSHPCDSPNMIPCDVQQLRNMRYKHCPNTEEAKSITSCRHCKEMFSNDDLVDNVTREICFKMGIEMTEKQTLKNMRILLLSENANLVENLNHISGESKDFLLQILRNMHKQRHTFTCFKKSDECRSRVPNRPCAKTQVHFPAEDSIQWHSWNGTKGSRTPFMLEVERHPLDVFMNQYNPTTSRLLQSNTNVQLGIDGGHIMYCTCYACKSNKKEEKQSMIDACEGLLRTIKKELLVARESAQDDDAEEAPNAMAFKRMFVSILACTNDYHLSAPLAKYLIANDSRFLCSHEFTNIPFYDFKNGNSTEAKLHVNKTNKAFISSSRDTYVFRPTFLEATSTSEFYSLYMVKQKSRSKKPDQAEHVFHKDAPSGYKNLRLVLRDVPTIPIIYHEMMEDARTYGDNILHDDYENRFPEHVHLAEVCAQKMLILFLPFRCEMQLKFKDSHLQRLRSAIKNNELADGYELSMQNMQDCRNSLNSGRMEDMVERNTNPLEDPDGKNNKKSKKDREDEDKKIRDHLDEKLSQIVADISEAFAGVGDENEADQQSFADDKFTLDNIREDGSNRCGMGETVSPFFESTTVAMTNFVEIVLLEDSPRKKKKRKLSNDYPEENEELTTARLLEVKALNVKRNFDLAPASTEEALQNVNATGSIQSILAWSKIAFKDVATGENDVEQQQSFQTIMADFILTYLPKNHSNTDSSMLGATPGRNDRAEIVKWKKDLYRMRGLNILKNKDRLIMFMTGAGGSGKSHVINNVLAYASKFCDTIGQPFDKRTIVVTAMTGVAATSILGETAHSAMCLNLSGGVSGKLNGKKRDKIINEWKNARLVIIDEISFSSKATLKAVNSALEILMQNRDEKYGGLSIVFTGDFLQLEPVSGNALFMDTSFDQWHEWINCFVELLGGHRFKDKKFMMLLRRLRKGALTKADYDALDSRVVSQGDSKDEDNRIRTTSIPDGTPIAVHFNKDRNAMNSSVFATHLSNTHSKFAFVEPPSHTLVVKCSNLRWTHSDRGISASAKYNLFNRCRDSDVETSGNKKFRDPLLKLFYRVPMMLTENDDVPRGIANGTIGELDKVVMVPGGHVHLHKINIDGFWVNCIESRYIEKLMFLHGKDLGLTFELKPDNYPCRVNLPLNLFPEMMDEDRYEVRMNIHQFPALVNHATTVHKLQGQTKESLFVANYNYQRNWVYVAFSRVQTMEGLFLRHRLDRSRNLRPHGQLLSMMRSFAHRAPAPFDEDQRT